MKTTISFGRCNADYCFCSDGMAETTRTIYATLTYHVGYDIFEVVLAVTVPSDLHHCGVYCALERAGQKFVRSQGSYYGSLTFRNDGSRKRLSIAEWLKDTRFRLTGHGTPVIRRKKIFI